MEEKYTMSPIAPSSAEKGPSSLKAVETSKLIVRQPSKLAELSELLKTFENLSARVSERTGEDASQDLGGAGAGATTGQGTGGARGSARDAAIKQLPVHEVMQSRLTQHIRQETRKLERMARSVARSSHPGTAHKLNEIYAKIRRLNSLMHELFHASIEVLKRFFIRVFIDNQPIL